VTSQANTSASTGTQNKSTSSVQGTTNNENNNNNNRESKNDSKTLSNVIDSNSVVAKLAATRSVLAEDTRQKLQDIMDQLEQKSSNSKFLKFVDGEEKVLLFDPNKAEHVVITYPTKEGEPENKPTNRIRFYLKEANMDGTVADDVEEEEWTTSETTGKEVLRWVLKGFLPLDVSRKGSGKFDTKYTISPHLS
jgi:hypothetical protein